MNQTWSSLKAEERIIPFSEINDYLPNFKKIPFQFDGEENDRFQMIVNSEDNFPINTCSKRYSLIQHQELVEQVERIIEEIEPVIDEEQTVIHTSKNKERLWIECSFPDCEFDPGDGNPIELRLHAFNSVDLSIPFEITFGWWRQICSNGMMAMESGTSFRHRHTPNLDSESISQVAEELWSSAFMDTEKYQELHSIPIKVESDLIENWINSTVNKTWGLQNASRIYHIMKSGHDGNPSYPEGGKVRGINPTELDFESERLVPGSGIAENMYDVINAVSWISSHQNNLKDRIKKMRQVPSLVKTLEGRIANTF